MPPVRIPLPSYHNHTRWSDGVASVEEFITAASAQVAEIGISDHFVLSPYGSVEWTMPVDRLGEYVDNVRRCAEAYQDVPVRLGVEADYFPETAGDLAHQIRKYPFDYVIGAVHFVGRFPLDSRAADWATLAPHQVDEIWRQYWRLVAQMAATGIFDIVAHLDLPKKFGYRPSVDFPTETEQALDAIRDAGMAIEINTAGWALPAAEQYPSRQLLQAAYARAIPIIISADAHRPDYVLRSFGKAVDLARAVGYCGSCRFCRRSRSEVPIPAEE